jgi:hypothetical protein
MDREKNADRTSYRTQAIAALRDEVAHAFRHGSKSPFPVGVVGENDRNQSASREANKEHQPAAFIADDAQSPFEDPRRITLTSASDDVLCHR